MPRNEYEETKNRHKLRITVPRKKYLTSSTFLPYRLDPTAYYFKPPN
jgi:hypothetical protein